jgi:hypothetical protein
LERRLRRLAASGICWEKSVSEHAAELEKLADENMSIEDAGRRGKVFMVLADSTRLRT